MASKGAVYTTEPGSNPSGATFPPPPYSTVPLGAAPILKGEFPVPCVCRYCHQQIVTRTEKKNGLVTWGAVGAIAILGAPFGCFLGCCLIPLCVDACKDTLHYCPACSNLLGHDRIFN